MGTNPITFLGNELNFLEAAQYKYYTYFKSYNSPSRYATLEPENISDKWFESSKDA